LKTLFAALAMFVATASPRSYANDASAAEPEYQMKEHILYREGSELTDPMRERCRLDVYYPENTPGFATVVWFHAGGLTHFVTNPRTG
jgi:acetyl esterase/lipase